MGSSSDWEVMQHAVAMLKEFGIAHEAQVISAHRMPDQMFDYAHARLASHYCWCGRCCPFTRYVGFSNHCAGDGCAGAIEIFAW